MNSVLLPSVNSATIRASNKRHLLIANPENRRVAFFQSALESRGYPKAEIIPYTDLIDTPKLLSDAIDSQTVVRIDSPGENELVDRKLIALGADDARDQTCHSIDAAAAMNLGSDLGRIRHLRQWYFGFQNLLNQINATLPIDSLLYNHPDDIQLMFDKPRCQQALAAADVPTAASTGVLASYQDIVDEMNRQNWKRVFIKPAHGSSASGVIAFTCFGDQLRAVTSVEVEKIENEVRFYNNLNLTAYTDPFQIEDMVNFFCRDGVQVEQWLPKVTQDGRNLDLRILVIGGVACHTVVRTSRSPITNLHLGNRRGNLDRFIALVGDEKWKHIQETACQAASIVPRSLTVGVDILVQPRTHQAIVLEMNAFGDLLPRVKHNGLDPWASQIASLEKRIDAKR